MEGVNDTKYTHMTMYTSGQRSKKKKKTDFSALFKIKNCFKEGSRGGI